MMDNNGSTFEQRTCTEIIRISNEIDAHYRDSLPPPTIRAMTQPLEDCIWNVAGLACEDGDEGDVERFIDGCR